MAGQQINNTEQLRKVFIHHLNRLYFGKRYLEGKMENIVQSASFPNLQLALAEMWDDVKHQIKKMDDIYQLINMQPADENCNPIKAIVNDEFCLSRLNTPAVQNDIDIILYVQLLEHINITSYRMLKTLADTFNNEKVMQLLTECFDESVDDDRLFVMVTAEYLGIK